MTEIKTLIKFQKTARFGCLVGYVTRCKEGFIRGIRESDTQPKMVCIPTAEVLNQGLIENALYEVRMVPKKFGKSNGYEIVSAQLYTFPAHITSTVVKHSVYRVECKFGNKCIVYDPFHGHQESVNTIQGVIKVIKSRTDIADVVDVTAEFEKQCNAVYALFTEHGHKTGQDDKRKTNRRNRNRCGSFN